MRSTTDETLTIPDIVTYDNLEELWESCKRLIRHWAYKYMKNGKRQGTRLFDVDDLMQSGFLALSDLGQRWPCQNGDDFRWHLYFACRARFNECAGIIRWKKTPEVYAESLDERCRVDGGEESSAIDMLADPSAEFEETIIEELSIWQDYKDIMIEIDKLPDDQRQALLLTTRDGLSCEAAGEVINVTPVRISNLKGIAIKKIRNTKTGRTISKNFRIRHVSINEFKQTHTSEVEKTVFWLCGLE